MQNRTVEFYENLMDTTLKNSLVRNAALLSRIHISPDVVTSAESFSDISQRVAIPLAIYHALITGAVSQLMNEYNFNGTGVPRRTIFGRLFGSNQHSNDQKDIAFEVVLACDQAALSGMTNRPLQECINEIKTHLEAGLLASTHPNDNFPKIVQAIVNKTTGIDGWEFSPNVTERLNQTQTSNRPGRSL